MEADLILEAERLGVRPGVVEGLVGGREHGEGALVVDDLVHLGGGQGLGERGVAHLLADLLEVEPVLLGDLIESGGPLLRGEDDGVDGVDGAVAGGHVGEGHAGLVELDGLGRLVHGDCDLVAPEGLEGEPVREAGAVPGLGDDVAVDEGVQGGLVLPQVVDEVGVESVEGTTIQSEKNTINDNK